MFKELKKRFVFRAGIGDRWDDNELHLELGCQSFILKEWSPDWDVVRKHLEMKLAPRVRYSQFNAEDIKKELLQRYELEQPLSCRFYDFGMNDIYLIRAGNTNYYLRISLAGIHQRIDYLEEMNIIKTLAERGIRAAVPVKMAHAPVLTILLYGNLRHRRASDTQHCLRKLRSSRPKITKAVLFIWDECWQCCTGLQMRRTSVFPGNLLI